MPHASGMPVVLVLEPRADGLGRAEEQRLLHGQVRQGQRLRQGHECVAPTAEAADDLARLGRPSKLCERVHAGGS